MTRLTLDLRAAATAEARRLTEARAVRLDEDKGGLAHCDGMGPLVTRARGSDVRRQLDGRLLLIWCVSCEDACGRSVESQVVACLVGVRAAPPKWRRRAWIRAILRDLEAPVLDHLDRAVSPWRDDVATVAGGFASARIERAHAIAARRAGERLQPFQAGLFDRRAERANRAGANESVNRDQQARARVAEAVEAATVAVRRGELLLVLTP